MTDAVPRLSAALSDRYRIERELGQGGMATVYLAQDLKHDRMVAVKVLRPELAAVLGADRFVVEIKTTAALQHPHILPLFDSGTADGFLYYVMPYIEGETLRAKLTRETQLGIDEAVRITTQVADALDYAHRHGVIHRDIKPENILLHDGRPMVADFGIALAVSAAAGGRMTETGLSLGTPHYMSPEQATAEKEITARSDVYSLGSVLYEMLAGAPPHQGGSAQQIIMKIITEEAQPVTRLRKAVPPNVAAAVAKSLEKLPADRFASAAEFAAALTNPAFMTLARTGMAHGRDGAAGAGSTGVGRYGVAAVVGLVLVAASALVTRALTRSTGDAPVRHWNVVLPDTSPLAFFAPSLYGEGQPALAISHDGARMAYVARHSGFTLLYLRAVDETIWRPLAGTEGASQPFFSPDGGWIGFFAGGELKKVAVAGGVPVVIARVDGPRGAAWTTDDRMLLSYVDGGSVLYWVPASGGSLAPLPGCSATLWWPALLPREQWIIGSSSDRRLVLCSLKDARVLVLGINGPVPADSADTANLIRGSYPRYSPSGHLLYLVGNTLTTLAFDPRRLRVLGRPVQIEQAVRRESWDAAGQYALADDGTLVFAPGADAAKGVLVQVERSGQVVDTIPVPAGDHFNIYVSPTGRRVAFATYQPTGQASLSLFNVDRGLMTEIPSGGEVRFTSWWPDGDRAVLHLGSGPGSFAEGRALTRGGGSWRVSLDGAGTRDSLLEPGWLVNDVSRDAEYLGVRRYGDSASAWLVSADGKQRQLLQAGGAWPVFSPDGHWVAFASRTGLMISAVPATGRLQTVGPVSADEPEWSPRGDELYYRDGTRWMAMSVSTRDGLTLGRPRLLFEGRYLNVRAKSYDVGPDGRFLLLLGPPEETVGRLDVVTGLFTELRRLAPPGRQ